MSIPQDLLAEGAAIGAEQDMLDAQQLAQAAPMGDFSADALARFGQALNQVLAIFGAEPLEIPQGDMQQLPPEILQAVMMIADAVSLAGLGININLDEIISDQDLMMLAGQLTELATSEEFAAFLQSPIEPEGDVMVEEDVTMAQPMPGGGEEVMSDEQLFMQRM